MSRIFEGIVLATTFPATAAFALICFTFFWRSVRSHTAFHGVLIWTTILMCSYVIVVPILARWPELRPFVQVITRSLLLGLAYQCYRYLRSDPPDWWKFRDR